MASATRAPRNAQLILSARTTLVDAETLARKAGVHPDVVRRLARLGLLEQQGDVGSAPRFRSQDAQLIARATRLRRDLGLNYAGAVLASELLARIDELERRLRAGGPRYPQHEVITWTRTV
jgi:hypothetical protein